MKHLLLLALLPFLARAAAERAAQKPNIFMMIVDDFGFANFGPHRTPSDDPTGEVQTPAMDALAREGLLLDRKCVSRGGMLRSALARIRGFVSHPPLHRHPPRHAQLLVLVLLPVALRAAVRPKSHPREREQRRPFFGEPRGAHNGWLQRDPSQHDVYWQQDDRSRL